jgi:hypothetical protein
MTKQKASQQFYHAENPDGKGKFIIVDQKNYNSIFLNNDEFVVLDKCPTNETTFFVLGCSLKSYNNLLKSEDKIPTDFSQVEEKKGVERIDDFLDFSNLPEELSELPESAEF